MKRRRIADTNTTCDFEANICRSSTPAPETVKQMDKQTEDGKRKYSARDLSSAQLKTTTNPVIGHSTDKI